jgi:thiol:disulfide interchange protein
MYSAIIERGYSLGIQSNRSSDAAGEQGTAIPEPILSTLTVANRNDHLVFVDFYAEWCLACKVLEADTLENPLVVSALEDYERLKVDTDLYPEAASFYKVVGMPTLLILNSAGEKIYRSVGLIEPEELEVQLRRLAIK